MKKNNKKSYIYPAIGIAIVIIIFAIFNFWSVGDFENYKKISKFKSVFLSKDINFKKFPPNEFLGLKLYDDFEKYLLVDKSEIEIEEVNNNKYYDIDKNKIKFTNLAPEYSERPGFIANEDGKLVGILARYEIELKNNNNFLNFCTKTRNLFFRQHNISKLNFKNTNYYIGNDKYLDFKNFDFKINDNNARFSIVCGYDVNSKSIKYKIIFFLFDINLWKDIKIDEKIILTSKKINNKIIQKYRNKLKKKE